MLDKILPTITEVMITLSDKLDFEKITDNNDFDSQIDPMALIIENIERKGKELDDKI